MRERAALRTPGRAFWAIFWARLITCSMNPERSWPISRMAVRTSASRSFRVSLRKRPAVLWSLSASRASSRWAVVAASLLASASS